MAQVSFKGQAVHTQGDLPSEGSTAPDFTLTKSDLSDVGLQDFAGKKKILNIVPSLDTGTCAASARRFNEDIKKYDDTVVLTVSGDTPFAQKRFCDSFNIDSVVTLSELRNKDFGNAYGTTMTDGPLAGLLARAVVVLDENNTVRYTQLVPEIANEPDYESALKAVASV